MNKKAAAAVAALGNSQGDYYVGRHSGMRELRSESPSEAGMNDADAAFSARLESLCEQFSANMYSPQTRFHLSQSAAKIAANLPEDRDAALFLLSRAADIHAAFFEKRSQ